MEHPDVLLVNMPFAALYRPTIGLSLLKAVLNKRGISCKLRYFTIPFAERIGSRYYVQIANQEPMPSDLLGEWIFAAAMNDQPPLQGVEAFVQEILMNNGRRTDRLATSFLEKIVQARLHAEPFVDECAREILELEPRIVGFTSVFHQNAAALALAQRIKKKAPNIRIIFGGDNCEGPMGAELIRCFPFVDAAVSGEGDIVLPEIVKRWLSGKTVSDLPGVYTQENVHEFFERNDFPNAPQVTDMNQLPYPDYDDFFLTHYHSRLPKKYRYEILFESSRGCWWGERSHCTFCGLSSDKMAYRSKSGERALEELTYLTSKYPGCSVTSVDNIIDLKYFKDLVPELASRNMDLHLFYETKANLKKDQVRLMKEAGFKKIQPGVESFSNRILDQMGKGVKALQNVQLLKWCKEYGIQPFWNLLWGFPGEDPAEYQRMTQILPLLSHLPAPQSAGSIRLDRFSPHFKYADRMGFRDVEPFPAYFHVYDLPLEAIQHLAYYFTFRYTNEQKPAEYTTEFHAATKLWWRDWQHSDLLSVDKHTHLLIWDFRRCAKDVLTILTGEHRTLYLACDAIQTAAALKQQTGVADIEAALQPLIDRGLMLRDGNSYLSLAIPLGNYMPNRSVLQQFQQALSRLGRRNEEGIEIALQVA